MAGRDVISCEMSDEPSWKGTSLDSPITKVAIPLIAFRDGRGWPSGTACVIGAWLGLTARHVLEDHFVKFEGAPPSGISRASYDVLSYVHLGGGNVLRLYIRRAWYSVAHDIAVIALAPACAIDPNHVWPSARLDPMPPEVDSTVAAFGYPGSSFQPTGGPSEPEYELMMDATTSTGRVVEVYERQRDSAMLNFPCFRVNARFDGGMSGGPVLNRNGLLSGVVCSNMPPGSPGDAHDSYVSTLWPVLGTMIDWPWDKFLGTSYPLLEFAKAGIIDADLKRVPLGAIKPTSQVTIAFPGFADP
jgi:hypothetical protein